MLANRFRVVGELGQGGMGTIYRVIDTLQDNREIALKTIRFELGITAEAKLRFKEEFRAMVKLQHPNTLKVYDYGQLDEQTQYLTMEIVSGKELKALIYRDKQLPFKQIYALLAQLLQALGFIHSRGYLHRDIKSDNIYITRQGVLKLMDFGLMCELGTVLAGTVAGSIHYVSPEVLTGKALKASSDLYAVGCLAYEMITGRLPFSGTVAQVLKAQVHDRPIPLQALRAEVPERLIAIVKRLLEKDPAQRYQSATEVLGELTELAGLRPTQQNLDLERSYLVSSQLVGRKTALQQMEDILTTLQEGQGASLFIGAWRGLGKTRLAQEFLLQAKLAGWTVLTVQCQVAGMTPYHALSLCLRPLIPLLSDAALKQGGPLLAGIFPELQDRGFRPIDPQSDPDGLRQQEALLRWVAEASRRAPLVLFVDDLHLADLASIQAFNRCVRELAGQPLLCLATFRTDETPIVDPINETIKAGQSGFLELLPFDDEQMRELLAAMLHEFRLSEACERFLLGMSGGNPAFLAAMLRQLMEEKRLFLHEGIWYFPEEPPVEFVLPAPIDASATERLGRLSPEALALARVAAVLGPFPDLDAIQAVSGLDPGTVGPRLGELIDAQILVRREERGFAFLLDRLRERLYQGMGNKQRTTLHQRCGESLEGRHPGDRSAVVRELAYHFARGHDPHKAFRYLCQAAEQALVQGRSVEALEHWQEADELLEGLTYPDKEDDQAQLWWQLGSLGYALSPAVAVHALVRLIARLETQGQVGKRLDWIRRRHKLIRALPFLAGARAARREDPFHDAPIHARKGWTALWPPSAAWVYRIIRAYGYLGAAHGHAGEPTKGMNALKRALELLPEQGGRLEGFLLAHGCSVLWSSGHQDALFEQAGRALVLLGSPASDDPVAVLRAREEAVAFQLGRGFRADATRDPAEAICLETERAFAFPEGLRFARLAAALWSVRAGKSDLAAHLMERMLQEQRQSGVRTLSWLRYLRPYLYWQRGELDQALTLAEQGLSAPQRESDLFARHSLMVLKGQIHLDLDQPERAEEAFTSAQSASRAAGLKLVFIQALLGLGRLALQQHKLSLAIYHLSEAEQLCTRGPARDSASHASAARLLAKASLLEGEHELALKRCRLTLQILGQPEHANPFEQAQAYQVLAEIHLAQGRKEEARKALLDASRRAAQLKNRRILRALSGPLEMLRELELDGGGDFSLPEGIPEVEDRDTRAITLWGEQAFARAAEAAGEQPIQEVLAPCLEPPFSAEMASLYWLAPRKWAGSRDQAGLCQEVPISEHLLELGVSRGGFVGIDLPQEAVTGRSVLGAEMPAVLVAVLTRSGQPFAALYLQKHDLSNPFEELHLQALQRYCAEIQDLPVLAR